MELIAQLTDEKVIAFLLLFFRFSAVLAFFPFFENQNILVGAKAALAFYLTVLFYPTLPDTSYLMNVEMFLIAILSEVILGAIAGIMLQIVFHTLSYAGEVMSFAMGFSMATAFDPMTNQQKTVVGSLLLLCATVMILATDMHHMIILFVYQTLQSVPLGGIIISSDLIDYILSATANLFLMGFTMAFPIIALIMLSDIIFGMIMKTNPQFNILVVGFPVKIAIAFVVLLAIIPAIMLTFQNEFRDAFNSLQLLFR